MPSFDRAELESMWQAWIDVNKHAQDIGDWSPLAEFYTEDASYGWMYQPNEHFMALGRDEIRDWALGFEMLGFDGWSYPYVSAVIDEKNGTCVGFWRQVSTVPDPSGAPYEVVGIGGSWFAYAGNRQWQWQRDFFDMASVTATIMRVIKDGNVTPTMQKRFEMVAAGLPGHYSLADLPAPLWPVPVDVS
ncbi:MAG: hypothetical protein QOG80_336 [Pseudonocardiales bacterium]|nr:hypothetical protein [Pseudonocardiales bacterium]